jgi:hypothetical protein
LYGLKGPAKFVLMFLFVYIAYYEMSVMKKVYDAIDMIKN